MSNALDRPVAAVLPHVTELRHRLHACAELRFDLPQTAAIVAGELTRLGVDFRAGLATSGVVGWILPTAPAAARRPAVALRADMDALPIAEKTSAPYASTNPGCMHACGHDGHTALLLGAAAVLAGLREQLPRPVKLIFQLAEESGGGAQVLVEQGAMTDRVGPAAGACFALHGYPDVPLGAVGVQAGPKYAASSALSIVVRGAGGHGAGPHRTRDPIVAACQIVSALQTVVSRNVSPLEPAVLTIAQIHGGSTFNVIPETVELGGTIRALSFARIEWLAQRAREVCQGLAAALGCTADLECSLGYPPVVNDPRATAFFERAAAAAGADVRPGRMTMGAEDFAFYAQALPSCIAELGLMPAGRDEPLFPLHSPLYDFNDQALPVGLRVLCELALRSGELPLDTPAASAGGAGG